MFEPEKWLRGLVNQELNKEELQLALERVVKDTKQLATVIKFLDSSEHHALIVGNLEKWIRMLQEHKQEKVVTSQLIDICFSITTSEEGVNEILKHDEAITLFLELITLYPVKLEYQLIRLMNNIGRRYHSKLGEKLLESPNVVTEFVEKLGHCQVPYIRNEVILLLKSVTKGNQEIQKMVAFGDGFPFIQEIILGDGGSNGTEIVLDCLEMLRNLLDGNALLVNLFLSEGGVKFLVKLLELENESDLWVMTDEKEEIILSTLRILEILLKSTNPLELRKTQQEILLLGGKDALSLLALQDIQTISVRIQALQTLSLLLRENDFMRESFCDSVEKLRSISMEAKNDKVRQNASLCLEAFFSGNHDFQFSYGKTCCDSLMMSIQEKNDQHAALVLSLIIQGNREVKEFLGRERFQTMLNKAQEWMKSTEMESDFLLTLLEVMAFWLHDFVEAVNWFRSNPSVTLFFLSMVKHHPSHQIAAMSSLLVVLTSSDNQFHALELLLIDHRETVSIDCFVERLTLLSESGQNQRESFSLLVKSLYRTVVVKLVPHSNTASIKWEKMQQSENKHLTEKIKYLEGRMEELIRLKKELELRLLPDNSPNYGGKSKVDYVDHHQKQMQEKEDEILKLMKRCNSLSDQEDLLKRLELLEKKNTKLKEKITTKDTLIANLSVALQESKDTMYANLGVLQNLNASLENRVTTLEDEKDVLVLIVGEKTTKIAKYREEYNIPEEDEEEEEDSCEEDV